MTARVKCGISPAEITSRERGRPRASRIGTVSGSPGRSQAKASRTSRVPATWKKPVAPLRSVIGRLWHRRRSGCGRGAVPDRSGLLVLALDLLLVGGDVDLVGFLHRLLEVADRLAHSLADLR